MPWTRLLRFKGWFFGLPSPGAVGKGASSCFGQQILDRGFDFRVGAFTDVAVADVHETRTLLAELGKYLFHGQSKSLQDL